MDLDNLGMNDEFKALEEEYHTITNALSRKISQIETTSSASEVRPLVVEAEGDIYDAGAVLKKMESEVRHYPYNLKSKAQQQVAVLRNSLEMQKKDLQRAQAKSTTVQVNPDQRSKNRQKRTQYKNTRSRLLEGRALVDESGESLANTQRVLDETQHVGLSTTGTLHEQREQLLRTRENVRDMDSALVKARRTLQRMARRTMTNKLITAVIILVELAAVGIIVYFKYLKKDSDHDKK